MVKWIIASLLLANAALAQSSAPDPRVTPGAVNLAVTQSNIDTTICVPGWSRTVRPPSHYTNRIKSMQLMVLGLSHDMGAYEEDHLVPLELAGSPDSLQNLWPEPWFPDDAMGAAKKDDLENHLHALVCTGQLPLSEAQSAFMHDWRIAYQKYLGGGVR